MKHFHIPRKLLVGEIQLLEEDLLSEFGVAIILAEPGAGKSTLLNSLANRFGTSPVKASIFERTSGSCIVVDAFDEVARIASTQLHSTLKELRHTGANRTILSSRSGEWSDSDTRLLEELMGTEPIIARLVPFDRDEQAQLFRHRHPDSSFESFLSEAARHDLTHLLGNPEFLNLFADAFVQADGQFTARHEIFSDAVRYLARETNSAVHTRNAPTIEQRIAWADEVFSRLLLSGSDGVSMSAPSEGSTYPRLTDLGLTDERLPSILDTRLFRPAVGADRHEPVHRIVAEYCAARALVRRLEDPTNSFTIKQCLSLIAPNGATRDDLRGLLGWIAALGSQNIQDAAIEVDPYAVLSNGDPSRLSTRSRRGILEALCNLEADDPFFRRVDRWRSFNASGFFSPDIVEGIRPLIIREGRGDLRALLLELLSGSPAVVELRPELEDIVLDDTTGSQCRRAALDCLIRAEFDLTPIIDPLTASGTSVSLGLAAKIASCSGLTSSQNRKLIDILQACSRLYPIDSRIREPVLGTRYFIQVLMRDFDGELCSWLLDELTNGLACTCGSHLLGCQCRTGISKIAGHLLDRYFDQTSGPHDSVRVWGWLKGLNFHRSVGPDKSPAVRVLYEDHALRHEIQWRAFEGLQDREAIAGRYVELQCWHAGFLLMPNDKWALLNRAFETGNVELWSYLLPSHDFSAGVEQRGPVAVRRHARWQALEKPEFMIRWAQRQRYQFQHLRRNVSQRPRAFALQRRRERAAEFARKKSLSREREIIEAGHHEGWLTSIAECYLIEPSEMHKLTLGLIDEEMALRAHLQAVGEKIPTLEQCALGLGPINGFPNVRSYDSKSPEGDDCWTRTIFG